MRRVLMICYYFPPLAGIGSLRALKFATYLPEFGWMPLLVAPRNGGCEKDPSLSPPALPAYRTGDFQLGQRFKRVGRLGTGATAVSANRYSFGRIRRFVRRWLYHPDGQIGWYPFAVAAGRRAIREGAVDVIFSSSFPITAHLVARKLHKETGIPWIAEFRDLWTDWGDQSVRRQRLNESTEGSILAEATEVVTVSPTYGDVLQSRGAKRVSILTNGFDPADIPSAVIQNGINAAYVGTYYPEYQDLATALLALGSLARDREVLGLHLWFVGNVPKGLDKMLDPSGGIKFQATGIVPHKDALRHISDANVLLLSGPISAERAALRGHVPAKTFEYLGSGRAILFVGDPNSDVAQLLSPLPCVRIVAPGDVAGARGALLSLLRGHEKPFPTQLERFTSRSLTRGLAEILNRASR